MMKKIILAMSTTLVVALAVGGAVISSKVSTADTLLNANAEAVASSEGVWGHCAESRNSCYAECGNCGAKYIAQGEHLGGSFAMSGNCGVCGKDMKK